MKGLADSFSVGQLFFLFWGTLYGLKFKPLTPLLSPPNIYQLGTLPGDWLVNSASQFFACWLWQFSAWFVLSLTFPMYQDNDAVIYDSSIWLDKICLKLLIAAG